MRAILTTASGREIDLLEPDPARISLADIAHHLSQINRWNGASQRPISVAQHSLLVSRALERHGPRLAMLGLLHDAHEAYMGDIATPVKNGLGLNLSNPLAQYLDETIFAAFQLGWPTREEAQLIDIADRAAAASEWAKAMPGPCPAFFGEPLRLAWNFLSIEQAREHFLQRFTRLAAQIPGIRRPD
jgi:5'-deoxynucleotidase YfbR-like HD superfamily hydrolase